MLQGVGVRKPVPEGWAEAIEGWLEDAFRSRRWSVQTRLTRCQHLETAARSLRVHPWTVDGRRLLEWFESRGWATETARAHRSSHVAFWGWAELAGHVEESPAKLLPIVRPSPPRPRPAPDTAYRLALAAADEREWLMLRLAAEAGLRRGEVAQVHTRDLVEDLDGWSLLVHGKGGRERVVPLPRTLATALRARPAGWVFPGDADGHLSARWVGSLIRRLLPDDYTMHTLRHRFATRAHDVERDLVVVQELLGHANLNTTRAYVAVPRTRLRETVEAAAGVGWSSRPAGGPPMPAGRPRAV